MPSWIRFTLRTIGREVFECALILSVLIAALAGVAIYVTAWCLLLPLRLAAAPRGAGCNVQALQDCGAGPCSAPSFRTASAAHALPRPK